MLKKALIVLVVFMTSSIFATSHTWTSSCLVDQVYMSQGAGGTNNYVHVALSNGVTYLFDATTAEGQQWYKTLNDALIQAKYVQIRYIPGSNVTFNYQNSDQGTTSSETNAKVLGVAVNR
jgi:ABC-type transport system involved in Fe-S cluster assembly fused permease/ATPase subunit